MSVLITDTSTLGPTVVGYEKALSLCGFTLSDLCWIRLIFGSSDHLVEYSGHFSRHAEDFKRHNQAKIIKKKYFYFGFLIWP